MRRFGPILFFALALALAPAAGAQTVEDLLGELDATIARAADYVAEKDLRIRTIENQLNSRGVSPEQQYEIYGRLYEEYLPYRYNSATEALENQEALALSLGDRSLLADVRLSKAYIYTVGGMYLEAKDILSQQLDTAAFSADQRLRYYDICQRFWRDYREYSDPGSAQMLAKARYYLGRSLAETPEADRRHQEASITLGIIDQNWEQADFLNRNLIAQLDPASHEYANQTYWQARICEALGRTDDLKQWYIRSAMADIMTATKDNASLFSLAQELYNSGDMQRAFNYTQFSLDDALFFDARLRQWQIASVLPTIQKGYTEFQNEHDRKMRQYNIFLLIMVIIILAAASYLVILYLRQRNSTRQIEKMNSQIQEYSASLEEANASLKEINERLLEANAAKEEYIGLFIRTCSDYIEKMKANQAEVRRLTLAENYDALMKMSSSKESINSAVSDLFKMFDEAFLKIYPKFVQQFNALLEPEARIVPKEGELLNTELRIFALIRLGITHSSDIASFLRYSVNTIYNYRAQIKKRALSGKEDFEELIKTLGN